MNGHIICTKCLVEIKKGANKCPVCCDVYPRLAIRNLYAQTVIGDLPGSCADCCTSMTRKELAAHHQSCEQGIVKCPFHFGNVQCNTEWKRKDIEGHMTLDNAAHLALLNFLTADSISPALSLLCEGSTNHAKFAAAVALEHLAQDTDYKVAMIDAGAITALVATMKGTATDRTKMAVADALCTIAGNNLEYNDTNRLAIAQAGGIVPIVRLLYEGETILSKNAASRALRALSICNDNVLPITTAAAGTGVIESLVALLSVPGADIRNIAATLENLANHQCNLLRRNKFKCRIPPLVALLRGLDSTAKDHAANALRNLCYRKANCTAVVDAGAIDALVAMLHAEGGESINQSAAGALRNIAEYGGKLSVPVVDALLLAWRT